MEKYFKNYTTSLADFYHHPLSYISDILPDMNWFLKPHFKQEQVSDVQVYTATATNSLLKEDNLPHKMPMYVTNMCYKKGRSKTKAAPFAKPNMAEECWEKCSSRSRTLVDEIERLERMIRELTHPTEHANLHEEKMQSYMVKDKNKKVQANIHNNFKNKTTETEVLPTSEESSHEIVSSEVNRTERLINQTEAKRSRSKLKSSSKSKQPSKVLFSADDFAVVVSKDRKEDKTPIYEVTSKSSQSKSNNIQESFSVPSSITLLPAPTSHSNKKKDKTIQESMGAKRYRETLCPRCASAGEAIIKARHPCRSCCPHHGRGLYYHNYITLPPDKGKADGKMVEALANELERQKAELQRVKEIINELMRSKNYAEKDVYSHSYQYKPPEKRYNDISVSQTTAELLREDVAAQKIAPTNSTDEKMTFSTTSQTSSENKKGKGCFKRKPREKKEIRKKKSKRFWFC